MHFFIITHILFITDFGKMEKAREWEFIVIPIPNTNMSLDVISLESVKRRLSPAIDMQVVAVLRSPST